MATFDYRKMRRELLKRAMATDVSVKHLYGEALNDIAKEFALFDYSPDEPFSFADFNKFGKVDSIMSRLENRVQSVVSSAVAKEFGAVWDNHDYFLKSVFGEAVPQQILQAFIPKIQSGYAAKLFLSECEAGNITHSMRVWNGATLGQMETAMQEALMDGMPATQAAKLLQQYLNDPESCFKRFRIKTGVDADGKSMYGRKWMKRVRNSDGTYSWFDADPRDYPVGAGVYHSSYKNALRYTRTTTNIAYRTADYERYQTESFVLGIDIATTGNPSHKEDICDKLAGRYPKDFKWTGWHPNCMCHQTPVLATVDEVNAMADAIGEGKDPDLVPVNGRVTDVPDNFKEWVADNNDRIKSTIENGKVLPYFLRDNGFVKDGNFTINRFSQYVSTAEQPIVPLFTHPNFSDLSEWEDMKPYLQELKKAAKKYGFDYEYSVAKDALDYESKPIGRSVLNSYYDLVVGYDFKLKNGILAQEWKENEQIISKLLGVDKGEPMSFWAANEMKGNPHFVEGFVNGYYINCQSSVVAYELRRRGYDVEAMMNTLHKDNLSYRLSKGTFQAWIDQRTGCFPKVLTARGVDSKALLKSLDELTVGPGRYHISMNWKNGDGHIMTFERLEGKGLSPIFYDPQCGRLYDKESFAIKVISEMDNSSGGYSLNVYRVDNLLVNTDFAGVVAKAGSTRPSSIRLDNVRGGWNGIRLKHVDTHKLLKKSEEMPTSREHKELANIQTSNLLQGQKSLKYFLDHSYQDELEAVKYIWNNPDKLRFVRVSPFGEGKDLSDATVVANLEHKKERKVLHYNLYEFEFNGRIWHCKTEVHEKGFEYLYCMCK